MTGEATDLVALKRLAEEATPGPWVHEKSGDWDMVRSETAHILDGEPSHFLVANLHHGGYVYPECGYTPEKVAAFIAAANPATILSLATLIEAQAAEIEEARRLLTIFDKHLGEDDGMWTDGSTVQGEWIGEGGVRHSLTFGLFRQVRAFLASRTEKGDADA